MTHAWLGGDPDPLAHAERLAAPHHDQAVLLAEPLVAVAPARHLPLAAERRGEDRSRESCFPRPPPPGRAWKRSNVPQDNAVDHRFSSELPTEARGSSKRERIGTVMTSASVPVNT
jgi:hypothetical protein